MPPKTESPAVDAMADALLDNLANAIDSVNVLADNLRKDQYDALQNMIREANQTVARNIKKFGGLRVPRGLLDLTGLFARQKVAAHICYLKTKIRSNRPNQGLRPLRAVVDNPKIFAICGGFCGSARSRLARIGTSLRQR